MSLPYLNSMYTKYFEHSLIARNYLFVFQRFGLVKKTAVADGLAYLPSINTSVYKENKIRAISPVPNIK